MALEKAALKALREKNGVTAKTWELHEKSKCRVKPKTRHPTSRNLADDFHDDEVDEDPDYEVDLSALDAGPNHAFV